MLEPSPPLTNGYSGGDPCCPHSHKNLSDPPQATEETPNTVTNGEISETDEIAASIDDENEPLGHHHFLYDVHIEYSPGGHLSSLDSSQQCFRMKYLPYMVKRDVCSSNQSSEGTSSSHSSSGCLVGEDSFNSEMSTKPIDVTKLTCAFLGNSEYVPSQKLSRRRVVIEMISAKLSQSATFNVPISNRSNLHARSERTLSTRESHGSRDVDNSSLNSSSLDGSLYENHSANQNISNITEHNAAPTTSKKFVNYTILIKTAPGLDSHPAVIERRFSDFLLLNQGLKQLPHLANIVDKQVAFPKKVYMGNFSVSNIAERSIVFAKLLDVCLTNSEILWSAPFISFLLDKELSEAHRLSLCGDPEDVQALIETVYFIEKKIYFNRLMSSRLSKSSDSTRSLPEPSNNEPRDCYSPLLPTTRTPIQSSSSDETISAESTKSNDINSSPISTATRSSPIESVNDDSGDDISDKIPSALSQRVMVTFCILILTYYRGENYSDLTFAVRDFARLVTSQSFIESIVHTRHFATLRACMLFLMNINRGNVIDEDHRLWFKQRLEDIDGAYAEVEDGLNNVISSATSNHSPRGRKVVDRKVCRVTNGDLTSMLRERNFCSFKSDKSS